MILISLFSFNFLNVLGLGVADRTVEVAQQFSLQVESVHTAQVIVNHVVQSWRVFQALHRHTVNRKGKHIVHCFELDPSFVVIHDFRLQRSEHH